MTPAIGFSNGESPVLIQVEPGLGVADAGFRSRSFLDCILFPH